MKTDKLEQRIIALQTKQRVAYDRLNKQIAAVQEKKRNRWEVLPVNTVAQGIAAEIRRVLDCGLGLRYATEGAKRDAATIVLTVDPVAPPKNGKCTQVYNVATDVEWDYRDVSGHHEPVEMCWAHSCSNASRYNGVRKAQRTKWLRDSIAQKKRWAARKR